jgi:hypothetical protein
LDNPDVWSPAKIHALDAPALLLDSEPAGEGGVVSSRARRPGHFGQRGQPRERQVLEMEQGGNVLRPMLALDAQNMPGSGGNEFRGDGFKLIHLFERQHAVADRQGFLGVPGLVVVEVSEIGLGHDHVMTRACRRDARNWSTRRMK